MCSPNRIYYKRGDMLLQLLYKHMPIIFDFSLKKTKQKFKRIKNIGKIKRA